MKHIQDAVLTTGTPVPVQPACFLKGRFALFFHAVQTLESRKEKSLLKLDAIHGHFESLSVQTGGGLYYAPGCRLGLFRKMFFLGHH